MELIIKPTSRCNFNCTFCSAGLLNIKHSEKVSEKLKEVLNILKPDTLIFTGGDPLMVSPKYYEEILSLGDWHLSFTTNLKDFYLQPDKWTPLFKNPRVGITTSFQYGDERRWDKNTPYTEEMFKKVIRLFEEKVGYVPTFISVISEKNEDKALDHIRLAKELNTQCKINGVLPMGLSDHFYPFYKMIDIWISIKESGLEEYWDNEVQFYNGGCNFNTNLMCESSIRTFWLNDKEEIQYNNCEDCASQGYRIPLDKERPIPHQTKVDNYDVVTKECLFCPLHHLCNGCKSLRNINKLTPNHCEEMKKRMDKIKEMGWKI